MDSIDTLLTRGVDKIYPSREALEKVLRSGKKLKLYQGFDPTGTQLHIGHAVGFRKLRQFQNLGHEVIFLIGDGTGQAGDPSGKLKTRDKFLTRDELRSNGRDYLMQAQKIVRFDGENRVKILYNSDWLNKLGLVEILNLAGHFSVQQLLERDMYQERIKRGEDINVREFLYPLLQGYDSVVMEVDLELGGTDQTFNMLAGRKLVRAYLNREKFVLTEPLLTDAKGTKIGKTEGNVIGITDAPQEFYGKIMNLGDDAIVNCFTLLTDMPMSEIERVRKTMTAGENPIVFKKKLAYELCKQFNDEESAIKAQLHFEQTFQEKKLTDDLPEFSLTRLTTVSLPIIILLKETQMAESNSSARRLIEQGAVEIDQTIIDIVNTNVTLKPGMTLRVGKKKFLRFV